jgi:hypothetical protein
VDRSLSNTTLGVLMATINASILLIATPDIFRGIEIDPLAPGNTSYLLWMILSSLVVTAVLVVAHVRPVLAGVERGVRVRARRVPDRRARVAAARRPLPARRPRRARGRRGRAGAVRDRPGAARTS